VVVVKATKSWRKSKSKKKVIVSVRPRDAHIAVFILFAFERNLTEPIAPVASSTPTSTLTWISWFCSLPGHEYFCEVTEDFIEDDFNLTGLNTMVPFWKEAMEMVLDVEPGVGLLALLTAKQHLNFC
jgi:hypothetical protein